MMKRKNFQSSSKSSDRIQIINILAATSIALMTVLVGLSNKNLSFWMIGQLSVSIPCLITSSLAYSKLGYRAPNELVWWNGFAWLTFSVGYGLMLNSMAILLCQNSKSQGFWFIGSASLFFTIYSLLDIYLDRAQFKEKALKLLFYLSLVVLGFLIPVLGNFL